jgi:hypothetical protein
MDLSEITLMLLLYLALPILHIVLICFSFVVDLSICFLAWPVNNELIRYFPLLQNIPLLVSCTSLDCCSLCMCIHPAQLIVILMVSFSFHCMIIFSFVHSFSFLNCHVQVIDVLFLIH